MSLEVNVQQDVAPALYSGTSNLTTVNTEASAVMRGTATLTNCTPFKGVQLRAGINNGGTVYIGEAGITEATGFPLEAGDQLFLPVDNTALVRAYNATANDVLHWIIV